MPGKPKAAPAAPVPAQRGPGADASDAFLATVPAPMGDVARAAAAHLRTLLPGAHESVADGDVGFGVAAGYKGLVFTLTPQAEHVVLGIADGASLNDPVGLLEGRGGKHRHVKLATVADVQRPALQRLLAQALARRR